MAPRSRRGVAIIQSISIFSGAFPAKKKEDGIKPRHEAGAGETL
jgi:hypothetical protein